MDLIWKKLACNILQKVSDVNLRMIAASARLFVDYRIFFYKPHGCLRFELTLSTTCRPAASLKVLGLISYCSDGKFFFTTRFLLPATRFVRRSPPWWTQEDPRSRSPLPVARCLSPVATCLYLIVRDCAYADDFNTI